MLGQFSLTLVVLSWLRAIPMVLFLVSYRGQMHDPIARILRGLALMNLVGALLVISVQTGIAPGAVRFVLFAGSVFYAGLSWYLYLVFLRYRRQGTH